MFIKYYKYILTVFSIMSIFMFCTIASVVNHNVELNESPDKEVLASTTTTTTTTATQTTTKPITTAPNNNPKPELPPQPPNGITVCVDAGHGWADSGTCSIITDEEGNPLYYEKDINLQISKLLRDELVRLGYTVIMIRESDDETSPAGIASDDICNIDRRVAWANKQNNIDLMISIHCDSFPSDLNVNGTRIYYNYSRHSNMSVLAPMIQAELQNSGAYTEAPKIFSQSTHFKPLRSGKHDSILVECGFITGTRDIEVLTDPTYQSTFADSVAAAIDNYFDTINNR